MDLSTMNSRRSEEHNEENNVQEYCASATFEQMVESDEKGIRQLKDLFGEKAADQAE